MNLVETRSERLEIEVVGIPGAEEAEPTALAFGGGERQNLGAHPRADRRGEWHLAEDAHRGPFTRRSALTTAEAFAKTTIRVHPALRELRHLANVEDLATSADTTRAEERFRRGDASVTRRREG